MKVKKKKKKLTREQFLNKPNGVYYQPLRSWLSIRECTILHNGTQQEKKKVVQKYLSDDQVKRRQRKERMRTQVVECLMELMEDHLTSDGTNRCMVRYPIEGGMIYEGLEDILDREGIDPKYVDLESVNDAWREFRRTYPIFPRTRGVNPRYIEKESDVTPTGEPKRKRESTGPRKSLFGHDISSVLRRMGFEGLDFDEAKKVLTHFGIEVKDTTIRGQLWCGTQKGKYGTSAKLTEKQVGDILYISMSRK